MTIEIALAAGNGVGEGPFWDDQEGRLWWVDITGKAILAWRPGETAPKRWSMPDFPAAVVLRQSDGALVALRDGLYRFDPENGALAVFCRPDADRPDNRSNEGKCDSRGRFWLGTMQSNLNLDGSARDMTVNSGALYCVHPDGRSTREVDEVGLSNSLAWSVDGRTLYFGDTLANCIWAFDCDPDAGTLTNRRMFSDASLPGACDGSAIDSEGCLWNARFGGGCLVRIAPDGRVDRTVALPLTNPTCCCFGGPDLRTLYITSARFGLSDQELADSPNEGALLALRTDVPGVLCNRFGA
ncbi:MAG: SMP-30/gluconolactonase/LRE family protein [Pseudomonadota bacterium]